MVSEQAKSEAALAAPRAVELGGKTFVCYPDKAKAMLAWRHELRRQVQADMADPIRDCNREIAEAEKAGTPLSPTMINAMTMIAFQSKSSKAKKVEPNDEQIAEQALTEEGSRWFSWFIIRQADPSITLDWVKEHTPTRDDVNALGNRIMEVMNLQDVAPN